MESKRIGDRGENIACKILIKEGYRVTARNYHSRNGEIDIIAETADCIAFVEVKTRSSNSKTLPREAVGYSKQRKLVLTAMSYLQAHRIEKTPMFDVIELLYCADGTVKYNHIKNAFDISCLGGSF